VLAPGRIVGDAPDKTVHADDPQWHGSLAADIKHDFFSATTELLISSPYFVPGKQLTQRLCDLASGAGSSGSNSGAGSDSGGAGELPGALPVEVSIITNSQTSTDVPFVHAGYSRYRKQLLRSGVQMYELRQFGATPANKNRDFGSANSSLHAKTFIVDRQRIYIGSLNIDPRSVVLNTEIGVLIDSPELAESVATSLTALMRPAWSYRVTLSPTGKLQWMCEDADGNELHFTTEPETSWWDRFMSDLSGLLPIEDQI
jgi:putative cardiolipin synthase